MTVLNTTTNQPTIKNVHVVYTVADRRGDRNVTVSPTGAYTCDCGVFALYGECKHSTAVKTTRQSEGRKF
jgi:hypothetical protein